MIFPHRAGAPEQLALDGCRGCCGVTSDYLCYRGRPSIPTPRFLGKPVFASAGDWLAFVYYVAPIWPDVHVEWDVLVHHHLDFHECRFESYEAPHSSFNVLLPLTL